MIRNLLIAVAAFFILPTMALADVTEADKREIDTKIVALFQSWQNDSIEAGFKDFLSPTTSEQPQAIRNIVGMTKQLTDFLEGPFQYELLCENSVGERLHYRKYIIYNDRAPYVVEFIMFKTSSGWVGQGINMRDIQTDDVAP